MKSGNKFYSDYVRNDEESKFNKFESKITTTELAKMRRIARMFFNYFSGGDIPFPASCCDPRLDIFYNDSPL